MRWWLCLLVVAACSKKSADQELAERLAHEKQLLAPVIAQHRATASKILERLRAADRAAIEAPPVTTAEPLATKLKASSTRPSSLDLEQDGIVIASPGWIVGTAEGPPPKLPLWPRLVPAKQLETLLRDGIWDASGYGTTEAVETTLRALERIRHAVFVRTRAYTAPAVDQATRTFTPGKAAGDVLVYSLADGARLGAFPFDIVQQRATVETTRAGGEAVTLSFHTELLRQIIDQIAAP